MKIRNRKIYAIKRAARDFLSQGEPGQAEKILQEALDVDPDAPADVLQKRNAQRSGLRHLHRNQLGALGRFLSEVRVNVPGIVFNRYISEQEQLVCLIMIGDYLDNVVDIGMRIETKEQYYPYQVAICLLLPFIFFMGFF